VANINNHLKTASDDKVLHRPVESATQLSVDGDFAAWSSFDFVTDNPYVASHDPNTSKKEPIKTAVSITDFKLC
jgi:hypothetical protein